ncbi:hypothetical protein FPS98_07915 [Brevibacillus brevis]|uniref:IstB-like ATP-binding domain-containing protein n=1 Tax=Brevibacillus brevis TaxID=1393 RepID=A0A517I526_BREBE|nr:hypothetical protein FPS98_07915 [Brevibacillus brevis]
MTVPLRTELVNLNRSSQFSLIFFVLIVPPIINSRCGISECYEKISVIVTSNLEFSQWKTVFGDNRLTAALIDRLVHHAHIVAFTGESYCLRNALSPRQN